MKLALLLVVASLSWGAKYDFLIGGAEDSELQPLLAALSGKKEVQVGAWTYWTGCIGKHSVVVSRTGMGPINAIASTTIAIERFHPAAVINQGTAGAHNPQLQFLDIVLGTNTVDYGAFKSDQAAANAGSDPTHWTPIAHEIRIGGKEKRFPVFAGDAKLLQAAEKAAYARGHVVPGTLGTAYEFNREIDRIAWVRKTYHTDSEDMESVYVAGVAAGFGVPFLAIRIISDSEYTHPKYEPVAGQYCAEFVRDLIQSVR